MKKDFPVAKNFEDYIKGSHWQAWKDKGRFFFEFDQGHFVSEFVISPITEAEFLELKKTASYYNTLVLKCQNKKRPLTPKRY